jgi:hypothetical protein
LNHRFGKFHRGPEDRNAGKQAGLPARDEFTTKKKEHVGEHGLRIKNHESRIKNSEGEFGVFKAERVRARMGRDRYEGTSGLDGRSFSTPLRAWLKGDIARCAGLRD